MSSNYLSPVVQPPMPVEQPDSSLSELLGVLRRHRILILVTVVLLTIPPTIYGLLLEREYTAVASVMVEPQANQLAAADPTQPTRLMDSTMLETQVNLIGSRDL